MIYVPILIVFIFSFFSWLIIHELSHLFVAKRVLNIIKHRVRLYPHMFEHENRKYFRWASVEYWPEKLPNPKQQFMISMAPRIMNIVACIMLPLGVTFITNDVYLVPWCIFWGVGLVDFIYNSIGITPVSDLVKAAHAANISPMILRVIGFGLSIISIVSTIIIL